MKMKSWLRNWKRKLQPDLRMLDRLNNRKLPTKLAGGTLFPPAFFFERLLPPCSSF
ncbi:hypothetical protein RISK_003544 [Rhodopirellula islandica]|uniref:Uncharacterized protein n=1 Tax=Rhodopirellula islandica TaxID=595434 RepID=A0A0J1BD14_RHOIS|nr:hypothetical protein RISK_003544 [Rhodopirellula islandica]